MKRGADKQLTQDDPESQGDDNVTSYLFTYLQCIFMCYYQSQFEDDQQQNREFKRADQSALASRPLV